MTAFGMGAACPSPCTAAALSFPVGQLHRVAATPSSEPGEVDETKRNVLKLLVAAGVVGAAGGGLVAGSLQYAQPPTVGLSSFPRVQLLDLDGTPLTVTKAEKEYNAETGDVLTFNYPLRNEPNFLLNVAPASGSSSGATNVVNGVGSQKSIVAFSAICQHLGCPAPAISYYPAGICPQSPGGKSFYIHCTCHGSTYDVTNGAANLTGPAVLPLPQVILEWDQGDDTLYAVNMVGPPVNGHLDTLTGDYGVGTSSQLTRQQPVRLCNFS
ncbi:MAG: Rieske 2Fe-2S domain-containing protein [Thermoplasmata archaeon]|nr:Rieske 2Fe-2S domain-containing protein [Thermoplasmata archaeon]